MTGQNSFKINIPEGMEIDENRSTFKEIFFKPKEKAYPKTWEEYFKFTKYCDRGYFLNNEGVLDRGSSCVYDTEEQVYAEIAVRKLTRLLSYYNDEWKPNGDERKFVIKCEGNSLETDCTFGYRYLLSFKEKDVRDLFLINFKYLIKEASPLLYGYSFKD